jgi:hypothetical protein
MRLAAWQQTASRRRIPRRCGGDEDVLDLGEHDGHGLVEFVRGVGGETALLLVSVRRGVIDAAVEARGSCPA